MATRPVVNGKDFFLIDACHLSIFGGRPALMPYRMTMVTNTVKLREQIVIQRRDGLTNIRVPWAKELLDRGWETDDVSLLQVKSFSLLGRSFLYTKEGAVKIGWDNMGGVFWLAPVISQWYGAVWAHDDGNLLMVCLRTHANKEGRTCVEEVTQGWMRSRITNLDPSLHGLDLAGSLPLIHYVALRVLPGYMCLMQNGQPVVKIAELVGRNAEDPMDIDG